MRDGMVGPLTADQLDLVKTIHTASQEMLLLVNELLDVATIEAGELKVALETIDLAEIVAKAVYLANIEAAKKQTEIIMLPHERLPQCKLDPNKIRQVVDNLLTNAVKFSPAGSTRPAR